MIRRYPRLDDVRQPNAPRNQAGSLFPTRLMTLGQVELTLMG